MALENQAPFVPSWAEQELARKGNGRHDAQELTLLRNFFSAWEKLHSQSDRKAKESSAETMVSIAHVIREYRAHGKA